MPITKLGTLYAYDQDLPGNISPVGDELQDGVYVTKYWNLIKDKWEKTTLTTSTSQATFDDRRLFSWELLGE